MYRKKGLLIASFLLTLFTKAQEINVLHYRYEIVLNDRNDTIQGTADIDFVLNKDMTTAELDLRSMKPAGKGMKVMQVITNDVGSAQKDFQQKNDKVIIFFKQARKGDTINTRITYKGIPEDGLIISKNKHGERTFFADNWPNRAHHWIPCVDRPDDKASFEFIVTAPSHYQVISNGLKVAERPVGNGAKETHWKEVIALPSKVMVIGVARFATKTYDNSPKDIPVSAWVYPQDSTKGFYDYGLAPEILKFFSDYIAPYPYKKLANVQSKTIFGGMENASAIFYAESSVTGDRSSEDLLAHEIAHQWFGDMASEKSFAHLWLSEGFATYLTDFYFEKKYGKGAAAERLKREREEAVAFARQANRPVVDSTSDLMSLLNANSYQKGAWVLHMLRNEVGDPTFQKIIQAYYHQFKGSNAETRDLEAVAENVSGKELTWFFDQWLYRPGVPILRVSSKVMKNELTLFLKQQGKPYRFNLEVDILMSNGDVVRKQFLVKDINSTFKIPLKGTFASLTVDPDSKLLFELKE